MSSKYPEKCHVRGCPCGYFSSKPPSESLETPEGDAGFLVPESKNQSRGDSGPVEAISASEDIVVEPPDCGCDRNECCAICCRACRLNLPHDMPAVPTFEQEWQDAPRWATNYIEQGRLRAVLFDVIDAGCTCESGEQHPWELDDDPDSGETEDTVNARRERFVDEVVKRLQTSKRTDTVQYWFIRGQHAKEVELLVGMNLDLREMVCVARERIRQ